MEQVLIEISECVKEERKLASMNSSQEITFKANNNLAQPKVKIVINGKEVEAKPFEFKSKN